VAVTPAALRVVTSDAYRGHDPPIEVELGTIVPAYDVPRRVDGIRAALAADETFVFAEPRTFGDGPILAVHDRRLLAWLDAAWPAYAATGRPPPFIPSSFALDRLAGAGEHPRPPADAVAAGGYWCFDSSTGIVPGTAAAARGSVDIVLEATEGVLGGAPVEYALCRPPGHHAGADYLGGFCFLNNAAIAVRHAQAAGVRRVAVLDVDYHHGNGTQAIFYRDGDVLVASLHGDPDVEYPYMVGRADETGAGPGHATNVNIPLPAGTDDDDYLAALAPVLERVVAHRAELLVLSLGVDGYVGDPLGTFALTADGFDRIGAAVGALGLPTLAVQEGGYAVDELGANVRAVLLGLWRVRMGAKGD
jgi:acetoin utilization deacetylase AcuC-like enzyme